MVNDKKRLREIVKPLIISGIVLCILVTIIIINGNTPDSQNNIVGVVEGETDERSIDIPSNYSNLLIDNEVDALSEVNDQLQQMTYGNIYSINSQDDSYVINFYVDYSMGGITYWQLSDPSTEVFILATTGEIILYEHKGWVTGSKTESQILTEGELIAIQFNQLPSDKGSQELISYLEDVIKSTSVDPDTGDETSDTPYSYWKIRYDRVKDNIFVEDSIQLLLLPNGDCSYYQKNWNMDISTLDTIYSVTQTEAEETAIDFAGTGSTLDESYKMILRPNNFWNNVDIQYGTDPTIVWVVIIRNIENGQEIFHIDGNEGTIIGGDYADDQY